MSETENWVIEPYEKQFCEFCHEFKPCKLVPTYLVIKRRKKGYTFCCDDCYGVKHAAVKADWETRRKKGIEKIIAPEPTDA